MIVREAGVDDAQAMARVNVDTWRTAFRGLLPAEHLDQLSYEVKEKTVRRIVDEPDGKVFAFVAEAQQGEIVGFAIGGPERTGNATFRGELYGIYVLDSYQRRGVGRRLVRAVVQRLLETGFESMLLWTLTASPYRRFYDSLGGRPVGEGTLVLRGVSYGKVAYGWPELRVLAAQPATEGGIEDSVWPRIALCGAGEHVGRPRPAGVSTTVPLGARRRLDREHTKWHETTKHEGHEG